MSKSVLALVAVATLLPGAPARAGERQQTVRENPFIEGQYDIFEDGRRTGTVRENPFIEGQYDLFDSNGRRTGTARENPFIDNQWDVDHEGD